MMNLTIIAITYMLCILLSCSVSASSVPQWMRNAEVYGINYGQWDAESYAKIASVPFVITNYDEAAIAKLHEMGLRVICYVTFYQMPPDLEYQNANIAAHPDWVMISEDGKQLLSLFSKPEGEPDNNPGWKAVCRNSSDYRKYAIAYTNYLMKRGADGIFIDNVVNDTRVCCGPEFRKHEHLFPDKDHVQVNTEFFNALRNEIKKYGDDKVLILNTDTRRTEWIDVSDGQMLESYICSWATDKRQDVATILDNKKACNPITDKGCSILSLSYVGYTEHPKRDDVFYCYAWAKISGFLWTDWFTGGKSASALLKLRLGQPLGPAEDKDAYIIRKFKNGLAVVSREKQGATLKLSTADYSNVYDVYTVKRLTPDASGDYTITLEPGQGRVFTYILNKKS